MRLMQNTLRLIYPDQCALCGDLVEGERGLCAPCWRQMPFLTGLTCEFCAAPLLGPAQSEAAICDSCLESPRPWRSGRAALRYGEAARRLVLRFKHGDCPELAIPMAKWMCAAGQDILTPQSLLIPVPSHWRRLLRRRYNQAAELSREIARQSGLAHHPHALKRVRATAIMDHLDPDMRFENLQDAIQPRVDLDGAEVVLIDDVLTSGATFSAATEACFQAGAASASVLVLARTGAGEDTVIGKTRNWI